ASQTWTAARAARISALDGTQPTLRQSPPRSSRSIRATLAPSPAAPAAVTSPAVPAPITTRLYRGAGSGLTQSGRGAVATGRPIRASLGSTSTAMSLPPCEEPAGPEPAGGRARREDRPGVLYLAAVNGAAAKLTLKRLHQMETTRYLSSSTFSGSS